MRQYDRELVADRGMEIEAQVLEVIREFGQQGEETEVSIRVVTNRLIDLHGEDLDRKITARWVGYVVRKKLGLKTYRRSGIYHIAESEQPRLQSLYGRYGLTDGTKDGGTSGLPRTSQGRSLRGN